MKKLYIFCLIQLSVYSLGFSQTNVGGLISTNTTWDLAGSPYIVVGNVLVNNSITLIIEPGVVVKFDSDKVLQIRGELIAHGTENDKIIFTSNSITPNIGDWRYILFEDESMDYDTLSMTGSILSNCIIEFGGDTCNSSTLIGALMLESASPLIDSCEIKNNIGLGIYGTDIDYLQILNSSILFNSNGGIVIHGSQNLIEIHNNFIYGNGSLFANPNLLFDLRWGIDYKITNNSICSNFGHIEAFSGVYGSIFKKNRIINNFLGGNSGSRIELQLHDNEVITNNIFANNKRTTVLSNEFMFLNGYGSFTNTNFSKNQIVYNEGYFWIFEKGGYFFNNTIANNNSTTTSYTIDIMDYPNFYKNNIVHNYSNTTEYYSVLNSNQQTSPDLDLTNNWWGTSDDISIQTLIFDWFDDSSHGIVVYAPYLTTYDTIAPVSPPINVEKVDLGGGNVQISWSPNQEADIAGYKIYWDGDDCFNFNNSLDIGNVTSHTLSSVNFNDIIAVTAYDNLMDNFEDQFDGNESWYTLAIDTTANSKNIFSGSNNTGIKIYPNPTTGKINIVGDGIKNVEVLNLQGKLLFDGKANEIDLSNQAADIYIIKVTRSNEVIIKKIVIE